ncbi:MAG TPA: hypothetical protein VFQ47_08925 [Nitrososphaera sp.]|jgi:hypothetical protein|nr:hypothetical protein [Nitrososphaera sp.]
MSLESELEKEIERSLPHLRKKSEEALLAELGEKRLEAKGQSTEGMGRAELFETGESFFDRYRDKIRDVICDAYAKEKISEMITAENVLAIATLLITLVGISAAFPPVIVAMAVLILKIGLNDLCKGDTPQES